MLKNIEIWPKDKFDEKLKMAGTEMDRDNEIASNLGI